MNPKDNFRKKLIYQSSHRGCKENDILLGNYAKHKIFEFNESEINLYKEFLDEDDWDIYNWIVGKTQTPNKYAKWLIEDIIAFNNLKHND